MQFYDDETTVADIKCELERLESVPFEQIVLVHAGEELTNDINLRRHGLTEFNQSNEIFIDMQARALQKIHKEKTTTQACLQALKRCNDTMPCMLMLQRAAAPVLVLIFLVAASAVGSSRCKCLVSDMLLCTCVCKLTY